MEFTSKATLYVNPINKQKCIVGTVLMGDNLYMYNRTKTAIQIENLIETSHLRKIVCTDINIALGLQLMPNNVEYYRLLTKLQK